MPTTAFETAFVSAMPRLDGSPDLVDTVSEYLSRAYAVNSLIDQYLGYLGGPGGTPAAERALPNIKGTCATLPPVMDRLGARLQDELDHSSV